MVLILLSRASLSDGKFRRCAGLPWLQPLLYVHVYLLVLLITIVGVWQPVDAEVPCSEPGLWDTRIREPYFMNAARTAVINNDTFLPDKAAGEKWFAEACPAQPVMYSCYFWGKLAASAIDLRRWESTDRSCKDFWPMDFLTAIKGRRLIFYGDSVMGQIWQGLMCSLYRTTEVYFHAAALKMIPTDFCPFGRAHCYFIDGEAYFPVTDTRIIFHRMTHFVSKNNYIEGRYVNNQTMLQALSKVVSSNDILIMNFGLHFNKEAEYNEKLKLFTEDFRLFRNITLDPNNNSLGRSKPRGFPRTLILESTPQHFPGQTAGYYSGFHMNQLPLNTTTNQLLCGPINASEDEVYDKLDWRNIALRTHLTKEFQRENSIYIVNIARALYSQYDAHIAFTVNWNLNKLDCVHWCFPSGIFDYIQRMIYNAIVYRYPN